MTKITVTRVGALKGHTASIYTMARHPGNAAEFFTGSGDGHVVRWNLNDLTRATVVARVAGSVMSLLPLGEGLLAGDLQGGLHLVLPGGEGRVVAGAHAQGVFDLKKWGGNVAAAGGDGALSVWSSGLERLRSVSVSTKSLRQIGFHPHLPVMAIGSSDHAAYVLDTAALSVSHRLGDHGNSVFCVCYAPDGRHLLTGSRDAHLRVWDAADDYRLLHAIPAHLFTINCIAYSPDGKYFATASRDKSIKVWDAATFELLKVVDNSKGEGHVNSVNKLLWTSVDNLLVSCSDDRSVMVWKIAEPG